MNKYNHLIREKRDTIQYMLDKGYNFTQIGKAIEKDRTEIDTLKVIILMLLIPMVLILLSVDVKFFKNHLMFVTNVNQK